VRSHLGSYRNEAISGHREAVNAGTIWD